jgi:hypothetical protein
VGKAMVDNNQSITQVQNLVINHSDVEFWLYSDLNYPILMIVVQ